MSVDFSTLEGVFTMLSPADLAGTQQLSLGNDPVIGNSALTQLLSVLENSGRGVLTAADLKTKLQDLQAKSEDGNIDLSQFLQVFSTQGIFDLGSLTTAAKTYQDPKGNAAQVSSIQEIIGKDFQIKGDPEPKLPLDTTIVLSRSPFFHPSTRNTRKAEVFLNSMPSTVLSQLVPYLQVEFQVTRDPSPLLQTAGTLKFLMGAVDKSGPDASAGANKAMIEGHQVQGSTNSPELDFVGMEMFTSPQTMVNPQPNTSVGTNGARYAPVIDPFRPFMSLEHCTISSVPAVGMYSYKKAQLTIKLHDRSRLSEISDLIRPRVYTGVTVWLTYGWRAPVRPGKNPYFDYINNNLLMREAYGIVNSNFTFDNVGQVVITLELFTKGINEMRQSKVSDNSGDVDFQLKQLKILGDQIGEYRRKLKLDPPDGINKEIRTFQVLDAAEQGEFPSFTVQQVNTTILQLRQTLQQTSGIDKDALQGLITTLQKLYQPAENNKTKFSLKERFDTRVTATIKAMFDEVMTGADPFLPHPLKNTGSKPLVGQELAQVVGQYNAFPKTQIAGLPRKATASFGKLFTVFALRNLISANVVDELQVFFYNLNEQCGPVSSHSIAEFPIDMLMFLDQYRQHVVKMGSERITMEDFLQLVVNAQFQDNRSIGYGMRAFYEGYDPKNPDAQLKDKEGDDNSQLGKYLKRWGTFKKPIVEMYVEVSHQRVPDVGDNDILQLMNYSAKDATTVTASDLKGLATRKIMRIHIYDKQLSPHKAAAQLLRADDRTGGFVSVPATDFAASNTTNKTLASSLPSQVAQVQEDLATGHLKIVDFNSNQKIKDFVSKMVPTIRYGSNGTTVTNASLASKVEPLLSTVQMIRTMTVKNQAHANGSGDGGIPLRVIPAQLQLTTLGNPLATMAQQYFCDFQTGTTLDNLFIVIGLTHQFSPGKFETNWSMGYSDAYGVFEGAPNIQQWVTQFPADASQPK
jgi:hypothetical protein